jgi:hypothetical protein
MSELISDLPTALKTHASWLVNAGAEDTRSSLSNMTGTPDEIRILQAAIATEKSREARSSRLKPMEAKLRKFATPAKSHPTEIVAPSWDLCRQLIGNIKLHFRLAICYQVMTGFELAVLKKELGFSGSGRRKENPHDGPFKSWEKWLDDELGIGETTAERWISMADVVKPRLKKLGGNAKLLAIAESSPSQLDAIQRQTLEALVAKVTDGDSQKDLLEELKLVKIHDTSGIGGDTSGHGKKDAPNLGQLAFKFFAPFAKSVSGIAIHPQRDAMLAHLAADSPQQLLDMELSHETALDAIRAAKAKRVNPAKP